MVRAIRGATTVESNTSDEIVLETKELLNKIMTSNNITADDIISIIFTATQDLNAEFPAKAAREMGLTSVPLLNAIECSVPGSLQKCIRVLMHINTNKSQNDIKHIYINKASILRPDLN